MIRLFLPISFLYNNIILSSVDTQLGPELVGPTPGFKDL